MQLSNPTNIQLTTPSALIEGRFTGQNAIVTGGASGMGRAQAIRLAAEGACVAIIDRDADQAQQTLTQIRNFGGTGMMATADLSDVSEVDSALKKVRNEIGPANLLFNNAGTVLVKAYDETSEAEYDHIMNTNVRSTFMVTRRVIPQMLEAGGGSIVLMSSISALRGFPLEAIYGASKAAVQALMMNITAEYRARGIRCNAICPAFVRTPHGIRELQDFKERGIEIDIDNLSATQLRICEPEEVASVALYLASREAQFLNGVAIPIDNGWMVNG